MRCPYCGSTASVEQVEIEDEHGTPQDPLWQMDCGQCGACGPYASDPDEAIAVHRKMLEVLDAYKAPQHFGGPSISPEVLELLKELRRPHSWREWWTSLWS